jgi:hypothetical protein
MSAAELPTASMMGSVERLGVAASRPFIPLQGRFCGSALTRLSDTLSGSKPGRSAGYAARVSIRCHPFDPLDRAELIRSVGWALRSSPCEQLPPERFEGAGIYAIYYQGDFDPYRPVALAGCDWPIYVGSAMPAAEQWGLAGLDTAPGTKLYDRLSRDHNSVKAATNLNEDDFQCRYLIIDDIWIPEAERLLLDHYKPLWNGVVDGFGGPGGITGRAGEQKSGWDTLHPGRPVAKGRASRVSADEIRARIAEHLDTHPLQRGQRNSVRFGENAARLNR